MTRCGWGAKDLCQCFHGTQTCQRHHARHTASTWQEGPDLASSPAQCGGRSLTSAAAAALPLPPPAPCSASAAPPPCTAYSPLLPCCLLQQLALLLCLSCTTSLDSRHGQAVLDGQRPGSCSASAAPPPWTGGIGAHRFTLLCFSSTACLHSRHSMSCCHLDDLKGPEYCVNGQQCLPAPQAQMGWHPLQAACRGPAYCSASAARLAAQQIPGEGRVGGGMVLDMPGGRRGAVASQIHQWQCALHSNPYVRSANQRCLRSQPQRSHSLLQSAHEGALPT